MVMVDMEIIDLTWSSRKSILVANEIDPCFSPTNFSTCRVHRTQGQLRNTINTIVPDIFEVKISL